MQLRIGALGGAIRMPLNNRLAPERRDWSFMAFSGLSRGAGVLFEEVTLDERIGPEAVALLIEPEPDELLAKRTLDLNLKAGIAATAYGPVLFLIWWIPPIVNGHPLAFYEQVMNPLYPHTSEVLRRVAEQTHLHVIVTDGDGRVLNLLEYQNTFGFVGIRAAVDGARVAVQEILPRRWITLTRSMPTCQSDHFGSRSRAW